MVTKRLACTVAAAASAALITPGPPEYSGSTFHSCVEAFMTACTNMAMSRLPPVELKTQVMRTENGIRYARNNTNGRSLYSVAGLENFGTGHKAPIAPRITLAAKAPWRCCTAG